MAFSCCCTVRHLRIVIVVQQDNAVSEVTVTFDLHLVTQLLKSALIVLSGNLQCPLVLCGHIPHVVHQR